MSTRKRRPKRRTVPQNAGSAQDRKRRPVQSGSGRNSDARRAEQSSSPRSRAADRDVFTDYSLVFVILFLVVIGLVMLYSTSSYEAALMHDGDSFYFLKRQIAWTIGGLAMMLLVSFIPVSFYRNLAWPIYGFSLFLVLLIIPFGTRVNGAKRWLNFGPLNLQPAEVSKIAVIIVTAMIIHKIGNRNLDSFRSFIRVMGPAVIQVGPIFFITSNLSSAIIIGAIAFFMYFVSCRQYRVFITSLAAGVGVVSIFIYRAVNGGASDFRSHRLMAWLDPAAYADGTGFQTLQALYAIGSGGFFGNGLGKSIQKLGYIPEAQNDMIFSVICEELGIFGAVGIMIMFLILILRLITVANSCRNLYNAQIVVGVAAQIAIQVVLNIAVVTNTIPNTGVSLPFISYGGSSAVLLLIELGMVLSIARFHADEDEE